MRTNHAIMSLSVCQPYAERIARGSKRIEYRSWRAPSLVGCDLLIVASKRAMPGYRGEPKGVAVCVVRVVRFTGEPGDYGWHLADPRRVAPVEVKGFQALYTVPARSIRLVRRRASG